MACFSIESGESLRTLFSTVLEKAISKQMDLTQECYLLFLPVEYRVITSLSRRNGHKTYLFYSSQFTPPPVMSQVLGII